MKIFEIDGFWKDDLTEFSGYVAEFDDTPEGWNDEDFFYYGLNEEDLINSSEVHLFTIDNYNKLDKSKKVDCIYNVLQSKVYIFVQ